MPEAEAPGAVAYEPLGSNPAPSERGEPDAEGVEAGAVFLARTRQQRRVWAVREGRVHFFVRPPGGGTFWSPGHPPHMAPTIALFLAEVTGRLAPGVGRNGVGSQPPQPQTPGPARPIPPHKNAYR